MCSFRREKHVPKGGPNGGDGGNGGNIYIRASDQNNTLLTYRFKRSYNAEDGQKGMSSNMQGKCGANLYLTVPCGTIVYDKYSDQPLGEVITTDDTLLISKGGGRGLGNTRFASSTNRAPRRTTTGKPGELKEIRLELKLLADVGLVGLPNAGKSTFLSTVSAARPKIADYPFTTLSPVLGVVQSRNFESMVYADIPGLIEHASNGAGLGIEFLRHIERTSVLLHFIDISTYPDTNPFEQYNLINQELTQYNEQLMQKPMVIVFSKTDLITPNTQRIQDEILEVFQTVNHPKIFISSVDRNGMKTLLDKVTPIVLKEKLNSLITEKEPIVYD